jgi:tetratricopeptide (TPR) repeat protein
MKGLREQPLHIADAPRVMAMTIEPIRDGMVRPIADAIRQNQIVVVTGERGFGQRSTLSAAVSMLTGWEQLSANGNWLAGGYLAGFHELIDQAITWCVTNAPEFIVQNQQSLKRIFPLLDLPQFTVPKDLTNTSTREERTRFYHHEYQIKLLFGLATFLSDYVNRSQRTVVLQIDDASNMSATAISLLKTFMRIPSSLNCLKFVLVDYCDKAFHESAAEIRFGRYSREEIDSALSLSATHPAEKVSRIYQASRGNALMARALVECDQAGLPVVGYLEAPALIDLYLATQSDDERLALLRKYVDANCISDEPIAIRNYQTLSSHAVDDAHLRRHKECLQSYLEGRGLFILIHAHSLRDPVIRLEALAEPSELLKCIGLYDTWFSYFGSIFSNADLRRHGSGNDPSNAVFINAAFVLYALGCSRASVPYLENFYATFPHSKFVPTVLYAQSMTYGRYQIPVNLPLAEKYALQNLRVIDSDFKELEKYHYIKVFAENAYAYIKARQGKFKEALDLCLSGNQKMLDIYGDNRFKLHQSILIYNTSQVYELVKDFDLAEKQLRLAISYDPYYGEYFNDLGNLLAKRGGRFRDAIAAYARAIELCPPYFEAYMNRGLLHAQAGDDANALEDFRRALEIKPHEWRALFEIGNISLRAGRYQEALISYNQAAAIEPRNADLQNNIGLAYSECGEALESVKRYRQAIAINPRYASVHNNLAIELFNMGRPEEALVHADLAVQIGGDPDFEKTRSYIVRNAARLSA